MCEKSVNSFHDKNDIHAKTSKTTQNKAKTSTEGAVAL